MIASGWMSLLCAFGNVGGRAGRTRPRSSRSRKAAPRLESLESIALLSAGGPTIGAAALRPADAAAHRHTGHHSQATGMDASHAPQTLPAQTLTLGTTLTNFQNLPLSPSLNLFNPSLGTLTSVSVSQSAMLQSNISSQNLDASSPAVITATLSGSYQINGLNQAISEPTRMVASQPLTAGPYGSGTDTVTFPPLQIDQSSTTTFTDPADLAFFTASSGRTTITPTMTATGTGLSTSPSSNLSTTAMTTASASVTVTYTYVGSCPTVGKIGRIGVHHQRTLLVVPFQGAVDPTLAGNPADYFVIARDGRRIRIVSASYDPATNAVTLRSARRLNVHYHFELSVQLPCPDGVSGGVERVRFGSKYSLIGFHDHQGRFVPVRDGRIVRFDARTRPDHGPGRAR